MSLSLVAFNVINNRYLLNVKKVPILFYKNSEESIEVQLKHNDTLLEFLNDSVFNTNHYSFASIDLFEYTEDNWTDNYKESTFIIQNLFKLKDINSEFSKKYLLNIFLDLYKYAYKSDYEVVVNSDVSDTIKELYGEILKKYKERIKEDTLTNYLRSQLQEKYSLNSDNVEFIIEQYHQIIS